MRFAYWHPHYALRELSVAKAQFGEIGGSGIGFAISKRMVELMVGKAGVNGGPGFVSLGYSFARMADLGRNALIASSRVSR